MMRRIIIIEKRNSYYEGCWAMFPNGTLVPPISHWEARKPTPDERERILEDIERHRKKLLSDFSDLNKAKSILLSQKREAI